MIHNNFRKLMRLFSRGSSGDTPSIRDFTDISGYTGTSTDYMFTDTISYSQYTSPTVISTAKLYTEILADNSKRYFYAMAGNSVENEADYTLGEYLTEVKVATRTDKDYGYVITTTIINPTGTPKNFNEIGLFFHNSESGNGWHGGRTCDILLVKEKLETSRIIGAGESVSISFSLFGDVAEESE